MAVSLFGYAAYFYLQGNPAASTAVLQTRCETYLQGEQSGGCHQAAMCDLVALGQNSAACTATVSDEVNCINQNAMIDEAFLNAPPSCGSISASVLDRYFADGGAFDRYNVVSNSPSCAAVLNCMGISP